MTKAPGRWEWRLSWLIQIRGQSNHNWLWSENARVLFCLGYFSDETLEVGNVARRYQELATQPTTCDKIDKLEIPLRYDINRNTLDLS
jgi:hypothetical protein